MNEEIKKHFESVFHLLKQSKQIIFPDSKTILEWDKTIKEWIGDESMALFVRKSGQIRGTKIVNDHKRHIIITDNTPAHWVFKNIVLNKSTITKNEIHELIKSNEFPIAFVKKKSEYNTLIGKMVASKAISLGNWKLAHIKRIGLKQGKNLSLDDYKKHHISFLSIRNMYLINKEFSGLAEVGLFNEIVSENSLP